MDSDSKGGLYSSSEWDSLPEGIAIRHVRPWVKRPWLLADLELAWRLWYHSRKASSAGFIEMDRAALLFCLIRSFLPAKGSVFLFGFYLQPGSGFRRRLLRRIVSAVTVCVVWSDRQGDRYSQALNLARERFATVRYKANHSQFPRVRRLAMGDYIFSGGDSERDYRTLFEAVRDLDIPVVVSTTSEALTAGCAIPENVALIQAREPFFARLMASSRLVVIPLIAGRLRGAGEASYLNAMWHGRPVICADDVSAPEYIENWVDGVVVPPGNAAELRAAIVALWSNRARAEAIGQAGRRKVEANYTHKRFITRMLALAGIKETQCESN